MYPATLDIAPRKITKHKSHLESSVFCWNQIKITHSTGNDFLYGQSRWILIWSTNKNVMKDKSLNVPATLDIAPRKITKDKSHRQSSVFCMNQMKITHWTGNDFFYGQSRWILIWSTNKNVTKDKTLNVPATLDIAPRKSQNTNLTFNSLFFAWINQKLHIQREIAFSMVNPTGFSFQAQIKMLWRIKAWMYLRHLTSHLGKSQNTNLTFNRLFFAWIQ